MQTPTILVVDDEQLIRWSLTDAAQARKAIASVEAETAADALKRLREGVDLVLLDYGCPTPTG